MFQIVDVRVFDTRPASSPHTASELVDDELGACAQSRAETPSAWVLTTVLFGRGDDGDYCVLVDGFYPELYYDVDDKKPSEYPAVVQDVCSKNRLKTTQVKWTAVVRFDAGSLRMHADGTRRPRTYLRVEFLHLFAYKRALWSREDPRPHHTKPSIESKFFVRTGLRPSGWVRLDMRTARPCRQARCSFCAHEFECSIDALEYVDRDDFAPLVVAALDIEAVPNSGFPNAEHPEDLICSVALVKWVLGRDSEDAERHAVLAHLSCDPIDGAEVHCCADERELLLKTRDLINQMGVDWLLVYNGRFDYPYMNDRASAGPGCTNDFFYCSKLRFHASELTKKKLSSDQMGDNVVAMFDMPGRANLDVFMWYKNNYKKASYTLNSVCAEETGETKLDFSYKLIKPYFYGTPSQRRELVQYNIQDCEILRELCRRLGTFGDQIELSRVSRVLVERLSTHGQGHKVVSQMNAKCVDMHQYEHPFILNMHQQPMTRPFGAAEEAVDAEDAGYVGATVIEPKTGYYETHMVIVCDFTSLYPSIMIAHNLCSSTQVLTDEDRRKPGVEEHQVSDTLRTSFSTLNPGVLPTMLKDTLAARKVAKKKKAALEQELDRLRDRPDDDPAFAAHGGRARLVQLVQVYDKRQLALKVSANSVYGFTGATKGPYPCKDVACTTTALGRSMLQQSCEEARVCAATLRKADGEPVGDLTIVYGDTDSIMFTLANVTTPEDASAAGTSIAEHITAIFHAQGHVQKKLEYEKCFKNFILFAKKRYCGIKYEPDGLGGARSLGPSHSGTANKRRDSCRFVQKTYDAMINPLLYDSDREASLRAFHAQMNLLLASKVDYDDLIVTKSLKSHYKQATLPQLTVVAKQKKREPGSEAQSGDRLAIIFVQGPLGSKVCDLAEDAAHVKEHALPIDAVYYLRKQLQTPCCSILTLLHPDAMGLFDFYEREAARLRHGVPRLDEFLQRAPGARPVQAPVDKRPRPPAQASAPKGKRPAGQQGSLQGFFTKRP